MGLITNIYKKNFLIRYDKDEAIPYFDHTDFPGLVCEAGAFDNTDNVQIHYFTYCYPGYKTDKLILFCPGMGPGHTAYLAEIETLCKAGYRVLTLDYTGCGSSGGEKMDSVNAPTRDVIELLELIKPSEEIVLVGHSLGGYTALNVINLRKDIKKAVVISGFISIADEMTGFVKLRILANRIKRFEKKINPTYGNIDNFKYIAETTDKLLWIHSTDDPMVNYKYNAGKVEKYGNPNVSLITVNNKRHNPQYSADALRTMNAWIGGYNKLISEKQLNTLEERRAYFADKPIARMTEQDPEIFEKIISFIEA